MQPPTPISIDQTAPVVARLHARVEAPPDIVWSVHLKVAEWPEWQPDIQNLVWDQAQLHGGGWFTWSTEGLAIRSNVYRVDHEARETFWGGPANGIVGLHLWRFIALTPKVTRVETEESWSGDPVEADVAAAHRALEGSLRQWLDRLQARAESVAWPR